MTRKPLIAFLIAAAPLALLPGCATMLQPAAGPARTPGGGAVAETGGVEIVTMTPDFPGIVDIEGAVTPVKVRIANNGTRPLLIRYSDFRLTAADGTVYPALPLRRIDGSATVPVTDLYDPIRSPRFRYRGFRVAPYYAGIYPGIPRFGGSFLFGRYGWGGYDAGFGGGFARVALPTPEMYRNVLPEGVLDPGGSLEGWLYFQHVDRREGAISFDASLMAANGAALGDVAIPYTFVR